jgi:hypothetical protein
MADPQSPKVHDGSRYDEREISREKQASILRRHDVLTPLQK